MSEIPTTIKNKELVEKRREQIVLAAINLFARKGFHRATLRDLSDEAGISHGNIYDYVGTKEDIFFLLHEYMDKLATDALRRSVETINDPLEKFRRMVRSEFNLMYRWADAILIIYQECHILDKPHLRELLKRESAHVRLYEIVLQECIKKELLVDCNTKAVANLIKVMVDAWVLKRWDLRGQVTQLEMEKSILDMVFYGLSSGQGYKSRNIENVRSLEGKVILFVNGGTTLGEAISSFLISRGGKLALYYDDFKGDIGSSVSIRDMSKTVKLYSSKEYGKMSPHLFSRIVSDFGSIDIVIQDLGTGNIEITASKINTPSVDKKLHENLANAQDLSISIAKEMTKRGSGKIVYLAPWAWDKHADFLGYRLVKAGIIALTQTWANRLASSRINVNCIVPGYIGGVKGSGAASGKTLEVIDHIPIGYLGEVQDIVETVYFLISDSSKYMTGQVLGVAGGLD
jgi:3-oxoacyl-[acyl-carrier protein] reductase